MEPHHFFGSKDALWITENQDFPPKKANPWIVRQCLVHLFISWLIYFFKLKNIGVLGVVSCKGQGKTTLTVLGVLSG